MQKKKATKIIIDRAEGPVELCGPRTYEGSDVWAKAQARINDICLTAPREGGYDKTDFTVEFEDGETYEGRIDLAHPDYPRRDISNLADHIAQHCFFYMGAWRPPHLTEAKWRSFLARVNRDSPEVADSLRTFWLGYEIPSEWAKSAAAFAPV